MNCWETRQRDFISFDWCARRGFEPPASCFGGSTFRRINDLAGLLMLVHICSKWLNLMRLRACLWAWASKADYPWVA